MTKSHSYEALREEVGNLVEKAQLEEAIELLGDRFKHTTQTLNNQLQTVKKELDEEIEGGNPRAEVLVSAGKELTTISQSILSLSRNL